MYQQGAAAAGAGGQTPGDDAGAKSDKDEVIDAEVVDEHK